MFLCSLSCTEAVLSDICLSQIGFGREKTVSLLLTLNNPNPLHLQAVPGCFQTQTRHESFIKYSPDKIQKGLR